MKKRQCLFIMFFLFIMIGCSDDKNDNPIEETSWQLTHIDEDIEVCSECYILTFSTDNHWSSFGISNMQGGTVRIDGDNIVFLTEVESIVEEKKDNSTQIIEESKYFELLTKVVKYKIIDNNLQLYTKNETIIYHQIK